MGIGSGIFLFDRHTSAVEIKGFQRTFALNFSPAGSFADYGVSAPAGEYVVVLDSDSSRFNGFGRVKEGEHHVALPERCPNGNQYFDHTLKLYLPARTALVLKQI